ncbi:MAG TPA: ChbG/HpnK family deacetylase [Anaeromyxobacter sp.]|nr:ChbG/HpnK family deacetylase [Anaeromyxobacter sp.]
MRRLALCADDYGAGATSDAGILRLARTGRLGAVSCQVAAPGFAAAAPALREVEGAVDLGLHLDLAAGRGGLLPLLVRSHARALSRPALGERIARQLDAFEAALGRPPAFVDGHQHVHALPVIRDTLLDLLAARYPAPGPAIRNTAALRTRGAKAALLGLLGGRGLRRALRARGIPHNADFAGVYGLGPGADYRSLFRGWLAGAADGALLMCHPGLPPGDPDDPIAPARAAELAYLAAPELEADCAEAGVRLARFTEIARGGA